MSDEPTRAVDMVDAIGAIDTDQKVVQMMHHCIAILKRRNHDTEAENKVLRALAEAVGAHRVMDEGFELGKDSQHVVKCFEAWRALEAKDGERKS